MMRMQGLLSGGYRGVPGTHREQKMENHLTEPNHAS